MDTFDERIDGQDFGPVPLGLDDCGIVADADEQPLRRGWKMLLDARD